MSLFAPLTISTSAQRDVAILGSLIACMWGLELLDHVIFNHRLDRLGIRPRTQIGLRGILFAPLLHGSWKHLSTNTLPLVVLGWLILLRSVDDFWIVTGASWLVSGIGVWLVGASRSLHIGASGVVFGYFGFLLSRSYFEQDVTSAVISLLVVLLYGPLIWGIFPIRRGVSWQGHLFGFVGGILVARYLTQLKPWLEPWLDRIHSAV